jgi:hypothetical protein
MSCNYVMQIMYCSVPTMCVRNLLREIYQSKITKLSAGQLSVLGRIIRRNTLSVFCSRFPRNIYIEWVSLYSHTLYTYISMVLEILLNIYRHPLKNYLNTSTKYILIIKSFFWIKPYEPGSIILS